MPELERAACSIAPKPELLGVGRVLDVQGLAIANELQTNTNGDASLHPRIGREPHEVLGLGPRIRNAFVPRERASADERLEIHN
jgi:hypothetical protein